MIANADAVKNDPGEYAQYLVERTKILLTPHVHPVMLDLIANQVAQLVLDECVKVLKSIKP